jgi:hypothetical protein
MMRKPPFADPADAAGTGDVPVETPCSEHAPSAVRLTQGRESNMTGGLSSSPRCAAVAGERSLRSRTEQVAAKIEQSAARRVPSVNIFGHVLKFVHMSEI